MEARRAFKLKLGTLATAERGGYLATEKFLLGKRKALVAVLETGEEK